MQTIKIPTGPLSAAFIIPAEEPVRTERPLAVCTMPAGFPSPAQDYLDTSLDLNEYLIRNKTATFYFRVSGQSMRNAGIDHGDLLVVDRSITPKHGHIVVATVDGDFTVKKLYKRAGVIELRPANPDFDPIKLGDGEELIVWGVVTSAVHTFV